MTKTTAGKAWLGGLVAAVSLKITNAVQEFSVGLGINLSEAQYEDLQMALVAGITAAAVWLVKNSPLAD